MNTKKGTRSRSLVLVVYLGLIASLIACAVVGGGTQLNEDGTFQLNDGVIEMQNEDGDWVPVAGQATFELVGQLEDTDPWTVAGVTLETNESTQVADLLGPGDLVRVRGVILEDGIWLAYSIEPTDEQTDPIIILIGVVDSTDPWVVNGIELTVTDETEIQEGIEAGMLVRVEILLLPDGTWEVLSIALLGDFVEVEGCVTVVATVVGVNGDEVQFLGWPTIITLKLDVQNDNSGNENNGNDNDGNDNGASGGDDGVTVNLSAGQVVLAAVCLEDGNFVVVQIIILNTDDGGDTSNGNVEKVLVCHKPNNKRGGITLSIASPAVPAHLAHGDTLGACP